MQSRKARLVLLALLAATCPLASASIIFDVSLDTSPLIGDPAAPFALEFQFNDGSGLGDGNNMLVLDNFSFGAGGAAVDAPSSGGGVSGSVGTSVSFLDNEFFNQFIQPFTPGDLLSFRVSLSTNVDAGGTPDEFSFAILDRSFTEIPTLGGFDSLLVLDVDSGNPVPQVFASDTSRFTAGGGPIALSAPVIRADNAVPEPSNIGACLAGLGLLMLAKRKRARESD